jgi:hypothetical protein
MLANAIVLIHLAFIVFATLGGFLTWKWPRLVYVHLPALAWATWIGVTGDLCPLTPLENHLRVLAGQEGYEGGFIEYYILPVLYPVGLTRETQWILAAVLVAFNIVAYRGYIARRRRRANPAAM